MSIRISASENGNPLIAVNDSYKEKIGNVGTFQGSATVELGANGLGETLIGIANHSPADNLRFKGHSGKMNFLFEGKNINAEMDAHDQNVMWDAQYGRLDGGGGFDDIEFGTNSAFNIFEIGDKEDVVDIKNNGKYNTFMLNKHEYTIGDNLSSANGPTAIVPTKENLLFTLNTNNLFVKMSDGVDGVIDNAGGNYIRMGAGDDQIVSRGNGSIIEGEAGFESILSEGNNNFIFSNYITSSYESQKGETLNAFLGNEANTFIDFLEDSFGMTL